VATRQFSTLANGVSKELATRAEKLREFQYVPPTRRFVLRSYVLSCFFCSLSRLRKVGGLDDRRLTTENYSFAPTPAEAAFSVRGSDA
jgi:hypothetical protein